MKQTLTIAACLLLLLAWSCSTSHKIEVAPVEVKPIHITIDVNVKVDRALDDFFSDIDNVPVKPEATNAQ